MRDPFDRNRAVRIPSAPPPVHCLRAGGTPQSTAEWSLPRRVTLWGFPPLAQGALVFVVGGGLDWLQNWTVHQGRNCQ
jgi:hypothetical protein